MATVRAAHEINIIDLTPSDISDAQQVVRRFEDVKPQDLRFKIETDAGEAVQIPAGLNELLRVVLGLASQGQKVSLSTPPTALTSVEAAKTLGMSRPTLMKLASEGRIPSTKVGSHTRFSANDIKEFALSQQSERRKSFDELRRFEDELGLID